MYSYMLQHVDLHRCMKVGGGGGGEEGRPYDREYRFFSARNNSLNKEEAK